MLSDTQAKKRLLTSQEVNREYGLGLCKLREMRLTETGPAFLRLGQRTVLYDREQLDAWLASVSRAAGKSSSNLSAR